MANDLNQTKAVRLAVEVQLVREKAVPDQEIERTLDRIRESTQG